MQLSSSPPPRTADLQKGAREDARLSSTGCNGSSPKPITPATTAAKEVIGRPSSVPKAYYPRRAYAMSTHCKLMKWGPSSMTRAAVSARAKRTNPYPRLLAVRRCWTTLARRTRPYDAKADLSIASSTDVWRLRTKRQSRK